jgi:hypothetical protein
VKAEAVFGPEVWRESGGGEWSFWDLWFCVVCLLDHGGDWTGLDAALTKDGMPDVEAKWSHLTGLTVRLNQAGLTAADLAGDGVRDPKARAKARTKVLKSHLYERDMTEPMRNPPSVRLTARCLFGTWPRFPVSPQRSYDTLRRYVDLDGGRFDSTWAAREATTDIDDGLRLVVARARNDAARLAGRRAALSLLYELATIANDSLGYVSGTTQAAIEEYARIDWRSAGVAPDVYWRDILGWCALAGEFATARMQWHADRAQAMRAYAVIASGRVTRFAATAETIGPVSWTAFDQLVGAALRRRRADVAHRVLDAAQRAGVASSWVRRRRVDVDGAKP